MSSQHSRPGHRLRSLVGWLALTFAAGAAGVVASLDAPVFYSQLDRPAWAPPAWVFGPVWTVLYTMMAVAAWLVWQNRRAVSVRVPIVLFVVQLVLNALWTWLFFRFRIGGAALAEIVVLVVMVAATLIAFWRVRRSAGVLLVPYLAWVSFATALTASVWQRNPTLL